MTDIESSDDLVDISKLDNYQKHKFIRKVYGVILIQIAIYAITAFCILFKNECQEIVLRNSNFILALAFICIFLWMNLICLPELMYMSSYKYITFSIITAVWISLIILGVSLYPHIEILAAIFSIVVLLLTLIIFTMQSRLLLNIIISSILAFVLTTLIFASIYYSKKCNAKPLCISFFLTLVIDIYALAEVHKIIKGTHRHIYSEQDYLVAVYDIYIDPVYYVFHLIAVVILFIVRIFKKQN